MQTGDPRVSSAKQHISKQQLLSLLHIGFPAALFFLFDFLMRVLFPVQSADTLDTLPLVLALIFFFLPTMGWGIYNQLTLPPQTPYRTRFIQSLAVSGLIFFFSFLRLLPPIENFWEDLLTVLLFMFLAQVLSANLGLLIGQQIRKRLATGVKSIA